MANTHKALGLARQLQDKLKKRLGTKVHDLAFASDGNPYIAIDDGTPAAGEANAIIKIAPDVNSLAKDVLGNAANAFTPHAAQLITEAPAAGSGPGVFLTVQMYSDLLQEVLMLGCKFEWYQATTGSAPALTDITPSKLKGQSYPDMYNPWTSQQ